MEVACPDDDEDARGARSPCSSVRSPCSPCSSDHTASPSDVSDKKMNKSSNAQNRKDLYKLANKRFVEDILHERNLRASKDSSKSRISLAQPDTLRGRVQKIVQHRTFTLVVALIVILNALYIGVETSVQLCQNDSQGDAWYVAQVLFSSAFVVELGLRLFADRVAFFFDPWNLFDMALVMTSVADTLVLRFLARGSNRLDILVALRFMRLIRLIRILRLVRFFKEIWFLVEGIFAAGKTLGWAWLLILVMLYIPAIFVTRTLGKDHPENLFLTDSFGSVPRSMYTLFKVMSMEGWADIARQSMAVESWSWAFFILFTSATTFAIMHVVVAVIVQNTLVHAAHRNHELESVKEKEKEVALNKICEVFEQSDTDGNGELTKQEFMQALEKPSVIQLMHEVNIDAHQAESLFDILDYDESGSLDSSEFIDGVMSARGPAKAKEVLAAQCDMWKAEERFSEKFNAFDQDVGRVFANLRSSLLQLQQEVKEVTADNFTEKPGRYKSRSFSGMDFSAEIREEFAKEMGHRNHLRRASDSATTIRNQFSLPGVPPL